MSTKPLFNLPLNVVIPAFGNKEPVDEVLNQIPIEQLKEYVTKINIFIVYTPKTEDESMHLVFVDTDFAILTIIREEKRGYGQAYKTGFSNVEKGIVITFDADGTYPIDMIPKFIQTIKENDIEFLNVNRLNIFEKGAFSTRNLIGNKILTMLTNILFLMKIKDSQSGMWVFKSEFLKKAVLESKGMEFSTEIKIEAWKKSKKFVELPSKYKKRIDGSVPALNPWKDGFRIVKFLFKKRFTTIYPRNSTN